MYLVSFFIVCFWVCWSRHHSSSPASKIDIFISILPITERHIVNEIWIGHYTQTPPAIHQLALVM